MTTQFMKALVSPGLRLTSLRRWPSTCLGDASDDVGRSGRETYEDKVVVVLPAAASVVFTVAMIEDSLLFSLTLLFVYKNRLEEDRDLLKWKSGVVCL